MDEQPVLPRVARLALFLDIDGTLLDFGQTPTRGHVPLAVEA